MAAAWIRRKRFEARLIANEVGRLFADGTDNERVPAEQLLGSIGFDQE